MEQTFTVAGTAKQNGITKVRFANDLVSRTKILIKNNCENINLIELPEPMTKLEALKHLESLDFGAKDFDAGYAITEKLYEKNKEAKRGEYKKPISISEIRARKKDVTPVAILEQTGFVDTTELEVD
tara:strand:- start:3294 stop:3674 length:381 start_codon:yes stop_codon:yes gene_type:complete